MNTSRKGSENTDLSQAELRPRLTPYRQPSLRIAIWQLSSTLGLLAGLGWLMWLSLSIGYWLVLLLAIPAAGMMVRLFIFQHDCGHGSFFRSRRANRRVGRVLAILTLTPYEDWRYDHALHHASHGDLDHRGVGDVLTLTVDEYRQRGWWGRFGYRLYRHPLVLFGLFPTLLFTIRFRIPFGKPRQLRKQRASVWLTNVSLLGGIIAATWLIGWDVFLLLYAPVLIISATLGVWLFYVQHQFNPTYWRRHDQWDRVHASLHGSSYYRLPKLLQWFTGNIGLHHIHHLDSRIPNYRLQQCLDDNRELLDVPPLTLRDSFRCAGLKLWDERTQQMVGFDAAFDTAGDTRSYRRLEVIYIACSSYDDDGYPRRFWRGILPSNTLGCLTTLTQSLANSGQVRAGVDVTVKSYDDTVQSIPFGRIIRRHRRRHDTKVVVGLVGVQTGQFARATDIALRFREAGVSVMIGGFHVSGSLTMQGKPTGELQDLIDRGVTLVKGEAESPQALASIFRDALDGRMQSLYEMPMHPDLATAPVPTMSRRYRRHFFSRKMLPIDTSRGCPFNCSFCTVINVLGHRMRCRSAERILATIEANYARGVRTYFFVDDNLARSPVWEALFDGLIGLRQRGIAIDFMMQVDTLAYRIPGFIDKAAQAGCYSVFIGMESLDAANLKAIGKTQNHVGEYAGMVDAWHRDGVIVHVGYIIGLPHDTPQTVDAALETLTDEIGVDQASFFMLTPLPGSRDHQAMVESGQPLDSDLNDFDSQHPTFQHPNITGAEWQSAYDHAWHKFYSPENITQILLRCPKRSYWDLFWLLLWHRYSTLAGDHPMFTGFGRRKRRSDRRPGWPREPWLTFAKTRLRHLAATIGIYVRLYFEFQDIWLLTRKREQPDQKALAELRWRWARSRPVLEDPVSVNRPAATVQSLLECGDQCLRSLARSSRHLRRRTRRRLLQRARQVRAWRGDLSKQMSAPTALLHSKSIITEQVLPECESAAPRAIRMRWHLTNHWKRFREDLRKGRVHVHRLLYSLPMLAAELIWAIRFAAAFHRKV